MSILPNGDSEGFENNDWGGGSNGSNNQSQFSELESKNVNAVVSRLRYETPPQPRGLDILNKDGDGDLGTEIINGAASWLPMGGAVLGFVKKIFGDIGCWGGQAYDENSLRNTANAVQSTIDTIVQNQNNHSAIIAQVNGLRYVLARDEHALAQHLVNKCSKDACQSCITTVRSFLIAFSQFYQVLSEEKQTFKDQNDSAGHYIYPYYITSIHQIQEVRPGDIVVDTGGGTNTGGGDTSGGSTSGGSTSGGSTSGGTNTGGGDTAGGTNGGSNPSNGLPWFDTQCGQIQAYSQAQADNFCRVRQNNGGTNSLVDWQVNAGSTTKDNTILYIGGALAGLLIYFNSQPKKRK